tara:strand:+ start:306 stop:1382 length:1077 start_codon:yes stop_codon:yes gene_type:complete
MQDNLKKYFKNKKVIITGHTGFKGTWLTLWLINLGANIVGISKDIHGSPSHYKDLKIEKKVRSYYFDIKDIKKLKKIFLKFKPDFVFHLAAQSMVKKSYSEPYETFLTNSLGSLNVLESLRVINKKCNLVMITSDKVYKNLEIKRGYHENDELGGKDPYSASKTAAETIIKSYSDMMKNSKIKIAVARAGNVIGGGDWNKNRLIPDCVKAWGNNKKVFIRNPNSTRPWQNVLDVVRGYLILAIKLNTSKNLNGEIFNFGPNKSENFSVIQIVEHLKVNWKNVKWTIKSSKNNNIHESKLLKLNSNKSQKLLGWKCKMSLQQSLKHTIEWYKNYYKKRKINVFKISTDTLKKYQNLKRN